MGLVFNPYLGPWNQVYHQLSIAVRLSDKSYIPIPTFLLPVQIESRVLVAGASSDKAKGTWRFAGRLIPLLNCGGADFGQAELKALAVPFNAGHLFVLPQYASSYQLKFQPFYWVEDCLLTVWEFDGEVTDSTEDLIRQVSIA